MIDLSVFDKAKRLAGALERCSDGIDLQHLASVLNYAPEQLQADILALCTIIADSFTSTVVASHVGGGVVFVPIPVIDESAERVKQCRSCANTKAVEDGRLTPEELDGICAACEERYQRRYLASDE